MAGVFITATGTDIGKTFVACGIIRGLVATGRRATVFKPVVSGFNPEGAAASDPGRLLRAGGVEPSLEAIAAIAPWRLRAPLAPDMAAAREGRTIDFDALLRYCRQGLSQSADVTVIEGVGGVMVPLTARHTVLDWMSELGLPLVLVAGSYLGSISHTLTALDVLARRRLEVMALVLSQSANATVELEETAETLRRFAADTDILTIARLPHDSAAHATFDALVARL
ncbi:MAG: dethiobiotin synthase [Proteobacteria bacterium]|nr:dethiobiotin synthase [Pseudomonadota bacterium]